MRKAVFTTLMLALLAAGPAAAHPDSIDSLRAVLDTVPDLDRKQAVLRDFYFAHYGDTPALEAARIMYGEAVDSGREELQMRMLRAMIVQCGSCNLPDSTHRLMGKVRDLDRRTGGRYADLYFGAWRSYLFNLTTLDESAMIIDECRRMADEGRRRHYHKALAVSKHLMAMAYAADNRLAEAQECYAETLADTCWTRLERVAISQGRSTLLQKCGNPTAAARCLMEAAAHIDTLEAQDADRHELAFVCNSKRLFVASNLAQCYIAMDSLGRALECLKRADGYHAGGRSIRASERDYHTAWGLYYAAKGDVISSIEHHGQALAVATDYERPGIFMNYIDAYVDNGLYAEAVPLYERALTLRDSMEKLRMAKDRKAALGNCQWHMATLEAEELALQRNMLIAAMIAMVVLTAAVLLLASYRSRRKLRSAVQSLNTARSISKRADRLKLDFLKNISCEFRSPLNAIAGCAELMASSADGDASRCASIISAETRNLIGLANDVLNLSRIESEADRMQVQRHDLILLCKKSMATAEAEGWGKARLETPLPTAMVTVDEKFVVRCLTSIIKNGVERPDSVPVLELARAEVRSFDGRPQECYAVRVRHSCLAATDADEHCSIRMKNLLNDLQMTTIKCKYLTISEQGVPTVVVCFPMAESAD